MKIIHSVEEFLSLDSSGLANSSFDCPICGKTHTVPIGSIHIQRGILNEVPQLAKQALGHVPVKPVVIYDQVIESFIQENVIIPLAKLGMKLTSVALSGIADHLLEGADTVGDEGATHIPADADLLIGAGSGVISDLTKWIATSVKKPFILVGTAPSMNGHASITGAMTIKGIKTTAYNLRPATAVVFDVDILSKAPMPMILSGMGDLTARVTANADWRLASYMKGVEFCPMPYQMMGQIQERYLANAAGIGKAEPQAIYELSEACLVSALTMTIRGGETSPSSGSEHVLSHFWDYQGHQRDLPLNFHGTQVGIATVMMLALYETLRGMDPSKVDPQKLLKKRKPLSQVEEENRKQYPQSADFFNQVARDKFIPDDRYPAAVSSMLDRWDELWKVLEPFKTPMEAIRQPLKTAGAPLKLAAIHRTKEEGLEAMLHGNHYRPRYTILDLAWELGVFPDAAEEILIKSGVI
jgi:glycerol-1-phosphate dehydrogenase [NAD(P)+]